MLLIVFISLEQQQWKKMRSYEGTGAVFFLLPSWGVPAVDDGSNGLGEDVVESILAQSAADQQFVSGGFNLVLHLYKSIFTTGQGRMMGRCLTLMHCCSSLNRSLLVPTKNFKACGLFSITSGSHLLSAWLKDLGSVREKQMRKTSVLGQERALRRLYSSWPAVSQSHSLKNSFWYLTVARQLSKTVGMQSFGKASEVQLMSREVFPTLPSPTSTTFIDIVSF